MTIKKLRCQISDNVSFLLKTNLESDFEGIIAQFQELVDDVVLCIEDGVVLKMYPESGPFPFPLNFDHKRRRNGIVEYYFRYKPNTDEETVMCVFHRKNAETFCKNYTDDINTSSSEEDDDVDEENNYAECCSDNDDDDTSQYIDDNNNNDEVDVSPKGIIHIDPSVTHITLQKQNIAIKEDIYAL